MPELVLELKENQIIEMVKRLKDAEKRKILEFLEDITWGKRFEELIRRLRRKAKGRLSLREITKEVEEVRMKRYESRH